jgi:hypothetical protein
MTIQTKGMQGFISLHSSDSVSEWKPLLRAVENGGGGRPKMVALGW